MSDRSPRHPLLVALLSLLGGALLFLGFAIFVQYRIHSQGLAL